MPRLPIADRLPAGYDVANGTRGMLAILEEAQAGFEAAGYGPDTDGELEASDLAGRKPLKRLVVDGRELVVRRFNHGGLMRWMTRERFLDAERPFRELIFSETLRSAGIRTPRVIAARALAARGGGWILDLLTERVENCIDLGRVLVMARRGELAQAHRRSLLIAVGELVRELHAHGSLHADLTPNNMLVERGALEGEEPRLWIIDLDGSRFVEDMPDRLRLDNLRRLYRHIDRRDTRLGEALGRTDYRRFFEGYDPDHGRWKSDWLAIRAAHERRKLLHAVGWLLDERADVEQERTLA